MNPYLNKRCKCSHYREDHTIRGHGCNVIICKSEFDGGLQEIRCRCVRYEEKL